MRPFFDRGDCMKLLLFLIPLLLYSSYSLSADLSGLLPSPITGIMYHKPVVVDPDGKCHVTWFDVPYTALSCVVNSDGTASGTWYQDALGGPGSGGEPSDISSPHFSCNTQQIYRRKGNISPGTTNLLYGGCNYSVLYDAKKDITTYTPTKKFDPAQLAPMGDSYLGYDVSQGNALNRLNLAIKSIDQTIPKIQSFISSADGEAKRYPNDVQSSLQLIQVFNQFKSAAYTDYQRIQELGYQPLVLESSNLPSGYGYYYVLTESGSFLCNVNKHCDFNGHPGKVVYFDKSLSDKINSIWQSLHDIIVYSKDPKYSPFKPTFNIDAFLKFSFYGLFSNDNPGYVYLSSATNNRPAWSSNQAMRPFMDFNLNVSDTGNSGDDSGGSGDSGGDVTPPDPGGDGGGGVTPPVPGGDGGGIVPPSPGGGGGGTDNPDISQCKPGAPDWPDCDDQSGQSGGGDDSGGSDSGGDNPGTGGGGTPGGGGGGHGSGGDGHGGGNTDGDGDALLKEVQQFHADVNAALNPDNVKVPDFDDKDVDLSGLQSDIDKQGEEQGAAWADASKQLESTLNGITGNLPSTKLDMSKVIPGGIPGVCRPWEFDIVIGLPDGKQLKQHVVMSDFCKWYDSYIRPFVTWVFNFITAVAVFNILYKGLRTIS